MRSWQCELKEESTQCAAHSRDTVLPHAQQKEKEHGFLSGHSWRRKLTLGYQSEGRSMFNLINSCKISREGVSGYIRLYMFGNSCLIALADMGLVVIKQYLNFSSFFTPLSVLFLIFDIFSPMNIFVFIYAFLCTFSVCSLTFTAPNRRDIWFGVFFWGGYFFTFALKCFPFNYTLVDVKVSWLCSILASLCTL